MPYIESRPEADGQAILLSGEWTVTNAADIEKQTEQQRRGALGDHPAVESRIEKLDTAGA